MAVDAEEQLDDLPRRGELARHLVRHQRAGRPAAQHVRPVRAHPPDCLRVAGRDLVHPGERGSLAVQPERFEAVAGMVAEPLGEAAIAQGAAGAGRGEEHRRPRARGVQDGQAGRLRRPCDLRRPSADQLHQVVERGRPGKAGERDAVAGRPWIAATLATSTIGMVLVAAPALVLMPFEANARLGGSGAYGAILAAFGAGSMVGALLGGGLRTRWPGVVAQSCTLAIALAVGGLAFLPLAGVLAGWLLCGAGIGVFQVLWQTALQSDVPETLLGRVVALDWLFTQGLMPVGYAIAGPAAALFGPSAVLYAGAALTLLIAPVPLLVRGGRRFSSREGVS
jgi:hypothetical protein